MNTATNATSASSLHPLLWIAGISVTLLSLVGIASMTGFLPATQAQERLATVAPVAAPESPLAVVAPEVPVVLPQVPPAAAGESSPATHHKTAKRKVEQDIPAAPMVAVPPPLGSGVSPDYVPPPAVVSAPPAPPACADCGVIANVRELTHQGKGSGAGAIIGGVAGGALASNIGKGSTRTLATIAGALGGGLLGNSVEKSQTKTVSYQVTVSMDDGSARLIDSATMPSWRIGDKVRLARGAIVSR